MLNLSVILEDSARRFPDKDAFVYMDNHLKYSQINAVANQVANGLRQKGIKPGDKIALSCLNLPYFPIIYFGILKAGAVIVPLSVLLKRDEIEYHLKDSDAVAYFCFLGAPGLPMLEEGLAGFNEAPACEHLFVITAQLTDASPIEGLETMGSLISNQAPDTETHPTNAEDKPS